MIDVHIICKCDEVVIRLKGAITSALRPNLSYTYDEAGNLTRRLYPDDSRHTFTFDPNGNRSTMVDPTGLYSYTYGELDRPREVANAFNNTITYAYDAVGQRATMIEPVS